MDECHQRGDDRRRRQLRLVAATACSLLLAISALRRAHRGGDDDDFVRSAATTGRHFRPIRSRRKLQTDEPAPPPPSPPPTDPAEEFATTAKGPVMCTRDYRPVCGSDGRVYSNACGAEAVGLDALYELESPDNDNLVPGDECDVANHLQEEFATTTAAATTSTSATTSEETSAASTTGAATDATTASATTASTAGITTSTSATEITMPTSPSKQAYWYPVEIDDGAGDGGVADRCVFGNDYPDAYLPAVTLFKSREECCATYLCESTAAETVTTMAASSTAVASTAVASTTAAVTTSDTTTTISEGASSGTTEAATSTTTSMPEDATTTHTVQSFADTSGPTSPPTPAKEEASSGTAADSGLRVEVYEGPTDCPPGPTKVAAGDELSMHYTGTIDASSATGTPGKKFDSSRDRGQTLDFTIGTGQVIRGWDEGIVGLCLGAKAILVIPPEMGYGDSGAGAVIPGGATLRFDVEVVGIISSGATEAASTTTPMPEDATTHTIQAFADTSGPTSPPTPAKEEVSATAANNSIPLCSTEWSFTDLGPLTTDGFESDERTLPFNSGCPPQWELTTDESYAGSRSVVNVRPEGIMASSDLILMIDVTGGSRGSATLSCMAKIDTTMPFDSFNLLVNGKEHNVYPSRFEGWRRIETMMGPGQNTIQFQVKNSAITLGFNRTIDVNQFGTGRVYLDNCEVRANGYAVETYADTSGPTSPPTPAKEEVSMTIAATATYANLTFCNTEWSFTDLGPLTTDGFESDELTLPFNSGCPPQWEVTTEESHTGSRSVVNIPAEGIMASSDLVLMIDAGMGGLHGGTTVSCMAKIDTSMPFDTFNLLVNGQEHNVYPSRVEGWTRIETMVGPGQNTIQFQVKNSAMDEATLGFNRTDDVNQFGTGRVYLDDCEVRANGYAE